MSFNFELEQANRQRDRRLRRAILGVLHAARVWPSGSLGGQTILDLVNGGRATGQQIEDEPHCLGLCRDLVGKGLAVEHKTERRRTESFGLRHVSYAITAKGSSLVNETIPADPDIDDDRIVD